MRPEPEQGDYSSAGSAALADLLAASHTVAPYQLGAVIVEQGRRLGAQDVAVYLVDYEQRRLVPLPNTGALGPDGIDIEATLAGRAFQFVEVLESQVGDHPTLWVPLLNGSERLGVIQYVFPAGAELTDELSTWCRRLTSLAAELVVSRSQYSDVFTHTRRSRPMALPAEIQRNLLPPLTLVTPQLTVSAALEPAYEVAGDAFDYAVNADLAHIAVFDGMGHGLEASLLATLAVGAYRHSRRTGGDLAAHFTAIDAAVASPFDDVRFVTAVFAELTIASGQLRFLTAGHPQPLLVRDGRVVSSPACEPSLPLGLAGDLEEVAHLQLEPGDRLLFFSDGIVEARAPDGSLFGSERLGDLLERNCAAGLPAPETNRRLTKAVLDWQSQELRDDATLLLLEWSGPGGDWRERAGEASETHIEPGRL